MALDPWSIQLNPNTQKNNIFETIKPIAFSFLNAEQKTS
jgi:hypothetical protein